MSIKANWDYEPPKPWYALPVAAGATPMRAVPPARDDRPDPLARPAEAPATTPDPIAEGALEAYVARATLEGDHLLRRLAWDLAVGDRLDEPLAAAAIRFCQRAGLTVDAAPLLGAWRSRIGRASEPTRRYPWPLAPDDRALLGPAALVESVELLLEASEGHDRSLGAVARSILDELRPSIDDDLAEKVLAGDPRGDTLTLWLLARHPLALEDFHELAVALAMRYAVLARRAAGLVHGTRVPADGPPLVSASAQLGIGLWALGLYPSLMGGILRFVTNRREADGSWGDQPGRADPITTLAAAELLAGLDPSFDPRPTIAWLVRTREASGWWRHVGREAPWLTAAVIDWLRRAERPFAERFAWPATPRTHRDRKTQLPRFEYFTDLVRAFEAVPHLADATVEVGFCDLAGFGKFNSAHGQEAGDRVLAAFTAELQAAVPGTRVIRDGGDEFLMIGTPTRRGLRGALDAFRHDWPERFRARFGAGLTVVAPRLSLVETTGSGLTRAREQLGIRIGDLKRRRVGAVGLLDG